MALNTINDIIADFRQGKMVILVDDEGRENEGDLLIAAEHVRPEDINFMARFGRGLICLTFTQEKCEALQLPLMVSDNNARYSTNFTVSIEAAEGVTTGISAADRATTVRAAVKRNAKPSDLMQPGHIFPLMAQPGGVLNRAGHTEAGVDLARLAGLEPASSICEILQEDGSMARLPELMEFAKRHGLKIGSIADLIHYRLKNEPTVERVVECNFLTDVGDFRLLAYHDAIDGKTHLALVKGTIHRDIPTLVRVHVHSGLYGRLAEYQSGGTWTISAAIQRVAREGVGVIVLLDRGEPAVDLIKRIRHFHMEDLGIEFPGRPDNKELRMVGIGSQILADIGVGKMRVLGRQKKMHSISGFGLDVVEYVSGE